MSNVEKCTECDAFCCRHVAVQIETPEVKRDFDTIRWYLMHENIWVSIDHQGDWLLEMRTPCRNIAENYKCKIYKTRPKICIDYPAENELCERQTDEHSYKHLFKNEHEFEQYLSKKKSGDVKKGKRRSK